MSQQVFVQEVKNQKINLMMYNSFKIASWNVCLGIANKKDTVTETLAFEGVDICCIQEADVPKNFPEEIN